MNALKKEISDQQAIEACLSGDVNMYRIIVERYKQRAYYLALMFTRDHEDALDLSQEAFVRAYRALKDYDPKRPFYSWFYRILKNLCINFVNHRQRLVKMDETVQLTATSDEGSPDTVFEQSERSQIVWKALQLLDEKDREIIIMKDFNEFSYQEIADALQIPLGSVMSRLYYARKRLLKTLKSFEDAL